MPSDFFIFIVLSSFPAAFALVHMDGFSHIPNICVNKIIVGILWATVGGISCLIAHIFPWSIFGAILGWMFELSIMALVSSVAFANPENSRFPRILKTILGF